MIKYDEMDVEIIIHSPKFFCFVQNKFVHLKIEQNVEFKNGN